MEVAEPARRAGVGKREPFAVSERMSTYVPVEFLCRDRFHSSPELILIDAQSAAIVESQSPQRVTSE
jgi:hypothetical protein